jgi:DNA primase
VSSFLVDILEEFLGDHRKHYEDKGQISFDCPACAADKGLIDGDGKGNLEVNYNKGVYKCWVCKDTNHMSGYIPSLIRKWGNNKLLKQYQILKPEVKIDEEGKKHSPVNLRLPDTFNSLKIESPFDPHYQEVMKYLKGRNITQDIIDYYNLGYTTGGKFFLRLIIPSYNSEGVLNYYSGRAFSWVKPKYKNIDGEIIDKMDIIFNEGKINWDATIYLVEGPVDHLVTPNSIPLLGKYMSDILFEMLIEKAKAPIVIVLDADAEKDTELLYKKLLYSPIGHLVRVVKLPERYDIAKIHQLLGRKGVIKVLRQAKRLTRFKY